MIIALTGHREERLNLPPDVSDSKWKHITTWLRNTLLIEMQRLNNEELIVFCGLATGSDMAIGYTVANMKKDGVNIKLYCIAPCKNYNNTNSNYAFVIKYADEIINIHDKWVKGCDRDRDDYMTSNCDKMIAIYDGIETGGVFYTVKKCKKQNKEIIYCPKNIVFKYREDS